MLMDDTRLRSTLEVHKEISIQSLPLVISPWDGAAGVRSYPNWVVVRVVAAKCGGGASESISGAHRYDAHSGNFVVINMDSDMFAGFLAYATRLGTNVMRDTRLHRNNGLASACVVP